MTGKAAHILGAAAGPGSRRYLETMTPEARSDISNASCPSLARALRKIDRHAAIRLQDA
jgi:hypothetical protein